MDTAAILPCRGGDDERGQLAECLAFISDMALTGDSDATGHRVDVAAASGVVPPAADPPCQLQRPAGACQDDDDDELETAVTVELAADDEVVPEPTDHLQASAAAAAAATAAAGQGRARWLRQRLSRLRLQRQRSAPVPPPAAAASLSASVDDSVNSHIQMLNSLDSQVSQPGAWLVD